MRERLTLDLRDQQRIDIVARWRGGALDTTEAVALLGCSERTAWRLRGRFTAAGAGGLVHGNRDRPAANRLPDELRARVVELATGTYAGFNDTHLAEVLERDEGIRVGRSTMARLLRSAGVRPARRRRSPRYRSRRERMPQAGLLVQIDGSPHDWLEGRGPKLTLVGGIDDATGVIVAARFSPSEDGEAYLRLLLAMCRDHGVPAAVYRDRSGIFAPTSSPRGPDDQATQVGRAFAELGIASVPAASPQAKGRIERLWGTCQDRLVSELRLARAADLDSANRVLAVFVPAFNAAFGVPSGLPEPAWRPAPPARDLERICAFRYTRRVGNDNTVRLEGAVLQLPATHGGRGLAGRRVELELRMDGRLLVVDRGRTLLAVPAPPDPARLRGIVLADPGGPGIADGVRQRPGYPPPADHPWKKRAITPKRPRLTESLSR
jgi:transposase